MDYLLQDHVCMNIMSRRMKMRPIRKKNQLVRLSSPWDTIFYADRFHLFSAMRLYSFNEKKEYFFSVMIASDNVDYYKLSKLLLHVLTGVNTQKYYAE